MESSFARWNMLLGAAAPCFSKEAFLGGDLFNWNSDEYDRISRHNYSATTTALAV